MDCAQIDARRRSDAEDGDEGSLKPSVEAGGTVHRDALGLCGAQKGRHKYGQDSDRRDADVAGTRASQEGKTVAHMVVSAPVCSTYLRRSLIWSSRFVARGCRRRGLSRAAVELADHAQDGCNCKQQRERKGEQPKPHT